jgi:hypothetical protein
MWMVVTRKRLPTPFALHTPRQIRQYFFADPYRIGRMEKGN